MVGGGSSGKVRVKLRFKIAERAALAVGEVISGPAILTEETATTYLDSGFEARVDASGCLFVKHLRG